MRVLKTSTVLAAIVAAAISASMAGTVSLRWDPSSGATGYRVFYGTAPGSYSGQMDAGTATQATISGLTDCTTWYLAVKAYNAAGSLSATYSNEVSGWPRPSLSAVTPGTAEKGQRLTLTVDGSNFKSGAALTFSTAGLTVHSITVQSCNRLTADVTIGGTAATGSSDVEVMNTDRSFGTRAGGLQIAAAVAPSVSSSTPADGATSVPTSVQPTVTFSEQVLAATLTSTNLRLLDDGGAAVPQASGSPGLSSDGRTATIRPAAALTAGETYRIQVVGGTGGVLDLSGSPMASTYQHSTGFTTADDTTAPTISGVAANNLTQTTARIVWTTSEPADSQVFYRKTGDTAYQQTSVDAAMVTSHTVNLSGLLAGTAYQFHVRSEDAAGNATNSPDATFTTADDTTAPTISGVAANNLTQTTARIVWTTSEPADSQVFYRKTGDTTYQQTSVDAALVTSHAVSLTGLLPETAYQFHVRSADAADNATTSPDAGFTTPAATTPSSVQAELEDGLTTSPVRVVSGAGAFDGGWVDTPSGSPVGSDTAPTGTVVLDVYVPTSGSWTLWVRMFAPDFAADSWFESVDGAPRQALIAPAVGSWVWAEGRTYTLSTGLHRIELGGREAQTRADRVLLTDDGSFVPTAAPGTDTLSPLPLAAFTISPNSGANTLLWTASPSTDHARTVIRYRTDGVFPRTPVDGLPVVSQAGAPGSTGSYVHTDLTNGTTYTYAAFSVDVSANGSNPKNGSGTPGNSGGKPGKVNNNRRR
jgi:hypothetical protein